MESDSIFLKPLIVVAAIAFGIWSGRAKARRLREIADAVPILKYGNWPRYLVLGVFGVFILFVLSGYIQMFSIAKNAEAVL